MENAAKTLAQKNRRTALIVAGVVFAMLGLSFASVPLYDLFCRVTGFGGTTQIADALPKTVIQREIIVRFDANTAPGLPWDFKPQQRQVKLNLGERGLAAYTARNRSNSPSAGMAVFNVTPLKAGKYFHKIQCFCFGEQIIGARETVDMPVLFFVDPAMNDDPNMEDVRVITLSYSFFKTDSPELEQALEEFYETQETPIQEGF